MKRSVRLSPLLSLAPFIRGGALVAFNVGPDGVVYLVVAFEPLDYRHSGSIGSFPKTTSAQPQTYRVVGLAGQEILLDVVIEREPFNIHDVQPLGDQLLLVCVRSHYRGPDDFERNGRVYNRDGTVAGEILLGDGIKSVQTTPAGVIWTSYFDEGVFGNFGWERPIGESGLVAWSSEGQKLYEFEPGETLDSICDCYALNVETENDVWLYYYTDFPLVHLRDHKIVQSWQIPVAGSAAFAISGSHALFRGGYKDRDMCRLFDLSNDNKVTTLAKIQLETEAGDMLAVRHVIGRGDSIYFISGDSLYRVDIESALAS
ncbi:MAG TPA: hypothetical protein VGP76_06460 [Planctomycetaceae bacterium]|jgi:hypothetical protein|nr:hypothetical protein [Planctomycetaceae bacterium]